MPSLPVVPMHSCMAAINATHAIISGGQTSASTRTIHGHVYVLSTVDNTWKQITGMYARYARSRLV